MTERRSFQDEINANKIKSALLIGLVFVFIIVLGYVISLFIDPAYSFVILIVSIIFSMIYTVFSYYNSDKLALAAVRAQPASPVAHRQLLHSVESMSIASGLPMPRVYVMDSNQINAFASGRNPQNAVICVTTGALAKLSKQELEGVIAHEMGHVANLDIRFMTITAVMVGMVSIAAEIFLRSLWFSHHDDRDGKANAVLLVLGIVFAILAPLMAQLVSLAISRKREFSADATAIKFTRYPPGLASALKKIKNEHIGEQDTRKYAKAMAPLFIANPFNRKNLQNLFSTHPDIDERIARVEAM